MLYNQKSRQLLWLCKITDKSLLDNKWIVNQITHRLMLKSHRLWLCCPFLLQILVTDGPGRNYWTANPTSIYGVKDIKRPFQLHPRAEWGWVRERVQIWWCCLKIPCHLLSIWEMWVQGIHNDIKTLWYMSRKWMKISADKVGSEVPWENMCK